MQRRRLPPGPAAQRSRGDGVRDPGARRRRAGGAAGGRPGASGNIAVIAAGTGLGEGMLLNIDGRLVPGQSEGGHADFAARTPRELEMVAALTQDVRPRQRRAHPLGTRPGQRLSLHARRARHRRAPAAATNQLGAPATAAIPRTCAAVGHVSELRRAAAPGSPRRRWPAPAPGASRRWSCSSPRTAPRRATSACASSPPPASTSAAASRRGSCRRCADGRFMEAFRAKAPLDDLVAKMPVAVILNTQVGPARRRGARESESVNRGSFHRRCP